MLLRWYFSIDHLKSHYSSYRHRACGRLYLSGFDRSPEGFPVGQHAISAHSNRYYSISIRKCLAPAPGRPYPRTLHQPTPIVLTPHIPFTSFPQLKKKNRIRSKKKEKIEISIYYRRSLFFFHLLEIRLMSCYFFIILWKLQEKYEFCEFYLWMLHETWCHVAVKIFHQRIGSIAIFIDIFSVASIDFQCCTW